jgi:hypothetical protein
MIEALILAALSWLLEPNEPFDTATTPEPPNYWNQSVWAALPSRNDPADATAGPYQDRQATAAVDVFFVHPTTYYSAGG